MYNLGADRALLYPVLTCVALAFGGCAAVDHFAPRAIDYNFETADAKTTTIVLNVIRAAYTQPLQFTDVSTISGLASVGATVSSSIPIPNNLPAFKVPQTTAVTPSATASGTNTTNVANLNTQEFYYGLQTPLSSLAAPDRIGTSAKPDRSRS
jgi:hypothetical protein